MGNANAVIAKRQTHPALWHCFCNTPTYHNTLCIYTLVIICHLQYIAEFFLAKADVSVHWGKLWFCGSLCANSSRTVRLTLLVWFCHQSDVAFSTFIYGNKVALYDWHQQECLVVACNSAAVTFVDFIFLHLQSR